jgi:sigma-B regulation protein RsbU (phosphoserine phosphatase)
LRNLLSRWNLSIPAIRIATLTLMVAVSAVVLNAHTPVAALDATQLPVPRDLNSNWLVHEGDDPSFSQPGLDDSHWTPFGLQIPLDTVLRGAHPQIVWYRLHIQVDPKQTGIALREETLARAFEIYVNGNRIIASGQFAPFRPYTHDAQILTQIPDRMVATGRLDVAVRAGITAQDWRNGSPGLSEGNLTLGSEATLRDKDWLEVIGQNLASLLDAVLTIALGLVALPLFISQRRQREYLWIFCLSMEALARLPVQIVELFHNFPVGWEFLKASFSIPLPFLLVAMYFGFVNRRIGPKFFVFLWIAGLLDAYNIIANEGMAPNLPGGFGLLTNLPFVILLAVVIPGVLALDWRRGNREAGILLIPAFLFSLYIYAVYALAFLWQFPVWKAAAQHGLNLIQRFPVGPFAIGGSDISGILSTIALAVIIVLRSGSTSRRQAVLEGELEAAREVQQVILPDQIETIPGFAIESAYEPAQQVGGDFFQIVPTGDGGLLLVLGDVAGKGLPAAMLVSVMVGAIRTTAEYTDEPRELLASMNERLIGRSRGGFSTALAAHISADGQVTIANAGHLSPYLDGREIELPGALPLGIVAGAHYDSTKFYLAPGSRITFYSDGVIEAQNKQGELLGFDRGKSLSTEPAAEIVKAAKDFGQSDDITVVAITRTAAVAAAA